jgi:hypothetical protein
VGADMERPEAVFRMTSSLVAPVILLMVAADAALAQSSSGEDLASALRPNVVQIVAHLSAEKTTQGFGFVIGEDSGQLYIVTANHVVRGDGPDEIDKKPTVIFFQDQGKVNDAELLGTSLPRDQGDLAVLRIQRPTRFAWNRNAEAANPPKHDTDVWFVGKLGEWYVPKRPGAVDEIEPTGAIRVDGLPVSVGTSGAPLISQEGILGMVVIDAGAFSEATPLEVIRRAIKKWNYPWQLAAGVPSSSRPADLSPSIVIPEKASITVWKVGSPHTGDTPDTTAPFDLEVSAEKIGRKLKIEAFPAKGFAETFFEAFKKGQQPDILVINNYGIIDGITTPLGNFAGIGSSKTIRQQLVRVSGSLQDLEDRQGGWEFLVTTAKNYGAAKLLALRSPACNTSGTSPVLPDDLKKIVPRIAWAYLQGAAASLKVFNDVDRLHTAVTDQDQLQVSETKECGYWGNDHLAFVPMVLSYESAKSVGQIALLLVFRRQQSQWTLLALSTDPTNTEFVNQLPKLVSLLHRAWSPDRKPIPARLLAPEDGQYPHPAAGQRFGDFTWQPSTSTDVVAEIIEFGYTGNARLFIRLRPGNFARDQVSSGQLWTTNSPWKWRVWSISEAGAVSFSETRSFSN